GNVHAAGGDVPFLHRGPWTSDPLKVLTARHTSPMARAHRNSVVVVGSSNTDMILRVARIPGPGETLLGGEFSTAAGGKGANQAVAARRAGGRVAFVARLGTDSLGDEALARFRKEGIDVTRIVRDKSKPSGVALIFVSSDGENSIGVAGGADPRPPSRGGAAPDA